MKKIIFIATIALVLVFGATSSVYAQVKKANSTVEVLYFHSKQRCVTCISIEKLTKEVLAESFKAEVASGKVKLRTINISEKAGEAMADKYEVSWSSLFVNKLTGAKEAKNNLTEFAFANAKNSPAVFKAGVKKKIAELLK